MYESYFGLSSKPFQLNPDPSFLFASRGHRRAMAYLEYGLHQGEGFIVITGDVGAGKTTIVRSLLERLNPKRIVAANLVSTQLNADDALHMVANAFGIRNKDLDKASLLLAIETFLVRVTASGKRALLVVDEAQNLGPNALEELRMLSNFQIEDHSLLQSFLIGQPEFRETMQSPNMLQLRQRVIASYHLGPLDETETQSYVLHRLRHVGWRENPKFEAGVFPLIHAFSSGIPRRINSLCDRLLLGAFLTHSQNITEPGTRDAIAELEAEFAPRPSVPVDVPVSVPPDASIDGASGTSGQEGIAQETAQALDARVERIEKSVDRLTAVIGRLAETQQVDAAEEKRRAGRVYFRSPS